MQEERKIYLRRNLYPFLFILALLVITARFLVFTPSTQPEQTNPRLQMLNYSPKNTLNTNSNPLLTLQNFCVEIQAQIENRQWTQAMEVAERLETNWENLQIESTAQLGIKTEIDAKIQALHSNLLSKNAQEAHANASDLLNLLTNLEKR